MKRRVYVDLTELAASGAVNWEKDRAADFIGPFGSPPLVRRDDPDPEYWQGATRKRVHYGTSPDMPSDWPYNPGEPYGQLRKTPYEKPKMPAREPSPQEPWGDPIATYHNGREPGRLWGLSHGVSPTGPSKKPDARPFWRRPRDTAIDGPRPDPQIKREPARAVFMSLDVLGFSRRLGALMEMFGGR